MSTTASTRRDTRSPRGSAAARAPRSTPGAAAGGTPGRPRPPCRDVFKGGASHYGVSDVAALARDTHKFESRYLDWLIGPYPQEEALYRESATLTHADKLDCPVIFFQG